MVIALHASFAVFRIGSLNSIRMTLSQMVRASTISGTVKSQLVLVLPGGSVTLLFVRLYVTPSMVGDDELAAATHSLAVLLLTVMLNATAYGLPHFAGSVAPAVRSGAGPGGGRLRFQPVAVVSSMNAPLT